MAAKEITVGMKGSSCFRVTEDMLASKVGSGLVEVFATPMMIGAVEKTAAASVQDALGEGKTTVGILVNVRHVAATPEGMEVRIETEVTEVLSGGKVITFKVECFDEEGLIGDGTHQRAVVDKARFEQKAAAKKERNAH